jgi:hypothetical protein
MAEEKNVSHDDVIKALVDNALAGAVHPDQASVLSAWREQHTSREEKQARLTDEERAQQEQESAGAGAGGDESKAEAGAPVPGDQTSPTTTPESASDRTKGKAGK